MSEGVVQLIASRCKEPESGGRMIDAILTNTMCRISAPPCSSGWQGDEVASVHVGVAESEFRYVYT